MRSINPRLNGTLLKIWGAWAVLAICAALALFSAGPARSQETVPQSATPDHVSTSMRFDTRSFLFARYASEGASVLYTGYGMGRMGVFFGIVDNPETGYNELIAGVNTRMVWQGRESSRSLFLALGAADVSDGDYVQLYIIPSYGRGHFYAEGTLELYQPLDSRGTPQGEVNPGQAFWRVHSRWSVGASSVIGFGEGLGPYARVGPAVKFDVPRGEIAVEFLWNAQRSYDQLRVGLQASF